jgi:hypothetical protein
MQKQQDEHFDRIVEEKIDKAMMEICKCGDENMRQIFRGMQFSIVQRIQFFIEETE